MSHDFQSSTSILLTNDDQQQLEQLQQQQPPLDTTQYGSNNNTPSKPTDKRKGKQAFDPKYVGGGIYQCLRVAVCILILRRLVHLATSSNCR